MTTSPNHANSWLNHVLRSNAVGTSYAQPGSIYLSLHFGDPAVLLDTEIEGGSYVRKIITFSEPVDKICANDAAITWANMPQTQVSHVGLWLSQTSSDVSQRLWTGRLVAAEAATPSEVTLSFNSGDQFTIPVGALNVRVN